MARPAAGSRNSAVPEIIRERLPLFLTRSRVSWTSLLNYGTGLAVLPVEEWAHVWRSEDRRGSLRGR